MKFNEYVYKRPDMTLYKEKFKKLIEKFKDSKDVDEANTYLKKINDVRNEFESMQTLSMIHHTLDTKDNFYEKEQGFFDESMPMYEQWVSEYYKALVDSPYQKELKEKWGEQLFHIARLKQKTFSKRIIEDLKLENRLTSEYTKLLSSAQIEFLGKTYNLPQMRPFEMSIDRSTRKAASEAKYEFFKKNQEKFDEIYDGLVKVRTKMAKAMGYENFIELGYARMLRTDYGEKEVNQFRTYIHKYFVPVATELRKYQEKRLKIDKLKYYDEYLFLKEGNEKPKDDAKTILENGKIMYGKLSDETKKFFDYMMENELMDVLSKHHKAPGGYCTYISKYQSPFIFSNFNATAEDIDVLTHEAGHAFQMYESSKYEVPEYQFPTLDACEIHSMSMEFLTYPFMDLFFKDASRYQFTHFHESFLFIPYGIIVDAFQHEVYKHPDFTKEERKKVWRELEKKYLPHRDYEDQQFLEEGGYWYQQGHIFNNPFYYIDYTLAGMCAFQFFIKARQNPSKAFKDYLRLCKAGGSLSFLDLVKLSNLQSPFEESCIEKVTQECSQYFHELLGQEDK